MNDLKKLLSLLLAFSLQAQEPGSLKKIKTAVAPKVKEIFKETKEAIKETPGVIKRQIADESTEEDKERLVMRKKAILAVQTNVIPGDFLGFIVPPIAKYYREYVLPRQGKATKIEKTAVQKEDEALKYAENFVPREARVLDLRGLQIEDLDEIVPLVEKFGKETEKIDYIYLDNNRLTEIPQHSPLDKFKGAKVISFTFNHINRVDSRALANHPDLRVVDLSKNLLEAKDIATNAFINCPKLDLIALEANKVLPLQKKRLEDSIRRDSNTDARVTLLNLRKFAIDFLKMETMAAFAVLTIYLSVGGKKKGAKAITEGGEELAEGAGKVVVTEVGEESGEAVGRETAEEAVPLIREADPTIAKQSGWSDEMSTLLTLNDDDRAAYLGMSEAERRTFRGIQNSDDAIRYLRMSSDDRAAYGAIKDSTTATRYLRLDEDELKLYQQIKRTRGQSMADNFVSQKNPTSRFHQAQQYKNLPPKDAQQFLKNYQVPK